MGDVSRSRNLRVVVLVGAYFALMAGLRLVVSPTFLLDESEQVLATQQFHWGYGSQPPLYTWLLRPLFAILGLTVLPLAVLKAVLLTAVVLISWRVAVELVPDAHLAILAAVALAFNPGLLWESQRDQTHLVLASVATAATAWTGLRAVATGHPGWFAGLGVAAAVGVLGKYNYLIFLVAFLVAGATVGEIRRKLWTPRLLLTLAVFVVITAPHGVWAMQHSDLLFSQRYKFAATETAGLGASGRWKVLEGVLSHVVVPGVVLTALAWRSRPEVGWPKASEPPRSEVTWLGRALGLSLALVVTGILAAGVGTVKGRWLQPLLLLFPVYWVARAPAAWTPVRSRWGIGLAATTAVVAAGVLYGRIVLGGSAGRTSGLNRPWPTLAVELRNGLQHEPDWILGDGFATAGNMRPAFPRTFVTAPRLTGLEPPPATRVVLVWDSPTDQSVPPAEVLETLAQWAGTGTWTIVREGVLQAPMYHRSAVTGRLGYQERVRIQP